MRALEKRMVRVGSPGTSREGFGLGPAAAKANEGGAATVAKATPLAPSARTAASNVAVPGSLTTDRKRPRQTENAATAAGTTGGGAKRLKQSPSAPLSPDANKASASSIVTGPSGAIKQRDGTSKAGQKSANRSIQSFMTSGNSALSNSGSMRAVVASTSPSAKRQTATKKAKTTAISSLASSSESSAPYSSSSTSSSPPASSINAIVILRRSRESSCRACNMSAVVRTATYSSSFR